MTPAKSPPKPASRAAGTAARAPRAAGSAASARAAASRGTDELPPNIRREVVTFTPELADQWLAEFGPNRPVKQSAVDQFAADKQAGRWVPGIETPFVRDEQGRPRNGQTRLLAFKQSGLPAMTVEVLHGLTEEQVGAIDLGRPRSFSDALFISNVPNARALAATAKLIWKYEQGLFGGPSRNPSHAELRDVVARHEDAIHDAIREVQRFKDFQPHSTIAFVYTLAREKKPKKARDWLDALQEGENLTRSNPVWHMRRLFVRHMKERDLHPTQLAALLIKSWNAYQANEDVTSLSWTDDGPRAEPFPTIRG